MTNFDRFKGRPEEAHARFRDFCAQFGCCSGCPFESGCTMDRDDHYLVLCFSRWGMSEERAVDLFNRWK